MPDPILLLNIAVLHINEGHDGAINDDMRVNETVVEWLRRWGYKAPNE
jgi:hypothetical protein